jgi:hypothetical protein
MATEQTITISEKQIGASKVKPRIDVQDVLLVVGFISLEIGTAMLSHAGAFILAGVLLMFPVVVFNRSK